MTVDTVRVSPRWLTLREPADAAARAVDLLEQLPPKPAKHGRAAIHDLGCGTGAMTRWLAPRLAGPQHWILYDRDPVLLADAEADLVERAPLAADGAAVTVQTRRRDITRLDPEQLRGAWLITASALLDMFTADELERFVTTCALVGCPVLITLSVVGRVELRPSDSLDSELAEAFDAHQRRRTPRGPLLGPDAADAAVAAFTARGFEVLQQPSPWQLGTAHATLAAMWMRGWCRAACEQQPELATVAQAYLRSRLAEVAAGRLDITVHHTDLLARRR